MARAHGAARAAARQALCAMVLVLAVTVDGTAACSHTFDNSGVAYDLCVHARVPRACQHRATHSLVPPPRPLLVYLRVCCDSGASSTTARRRSTTLATRSCTRLWCAATCPQARVATAAHSAPLPSTPLVASTRAWASPVPPPPAGSSWTAARQAAVRARRSRMCTCHGARERATQGATGNATPLPDTLAPMCATVTVPRRERYVRRRHDVPPARGRGCEHHHRGRV